MDFKKMGLVLSHEYTIRVKKKSFILTTIITPILFAALMIVPSLIMTADLDNSVDRILVVDNSGIVADKLENSAKIIYEISESKDFEAIKAGIDTLDVYAVMQISQLDAANNVSVDAYATQQINASVSETIRSDVHAVIEKYKLSQYDIENFEEILADLNTGVSMNTYILGSDGQDKQSMVEVNMGVSFVMGFIIYMFVVMFGQMVMTSVINEKSNKIVEVIVSSVKPFELMIGKIIGVACVALTQFLIWVVLTGALVVGFSAFAGPSQMDPAATEQMMSMSGMDAQMVESLSDSNVVAEMLSVFKGIDIPLILGCFLIYFVLGYLLYASMFAAIGSAMDNEADSQQLVMPVTIPLIIGLFIMLQTFQNPDGAISVWASIIPWTSPMVMLARIPFEGCVQTWELLLSIGLLLATFLITVYLSGKIYRVGILMHGSKYSWKDLYKWLKY